MFSAYAGQLAGVQVDHPLLKREQARSVELVEIELGGREELGLVESYASGSRPRSDDCKGLHVRKLPERAVEVCGQLGHGRRIQATRERSQPAEQSRIAQEVNAAELDEAERLPDEDQATRHRSWCQSMLCDDCFDSRDLVDQLLDLPAGVRLVLPQAAATDGHLSAPGLAVQDHHPTRPDQDVVEVGAAGAGPVPAVQSSPAVRLEADEEIAHDLLAALPLLVVEPALSSFPGGVQVGIGKAALAFRVLCQHRHPGVLGRGAVRLISASE